MCEYPSTIIKNNNNFHLKPFKFYYEPKEQVEVECNNGFIIDTTTTATATITSENYNNNSDRNNNDNDGDESTTIIEYNNNNNVAILKTATKRTVMQITCDHNGQWAETMPKCIKV